MWINCSQIVGEMYMWSPCAQSNWNPWMLALVGRSSNSQLKMWFYPDCTGDSTLNVPMNQWVHLAWVRTGTNQIAYFIDGAVAGAASSNNNQTYNTSTWSSVSIGAWPSYEAWSQAYRLGAHIGQVKVLKGIKYMAAFTPPRMLEADADTIMLLGPKATEKISNSQLDVGGMVPSGAMYSAPL